MGPFENIMHPKPNPMQCSRWRRKPMSYLISAWSSNVPTQPVMQQQLW